MEKIDNNHDLTGLAHLQPPLVVLLHLLRLLLDGAQFSKKRKRGIFSHAFLLISWWDRKTENVEGRKKEKVMGV